MLRRAGLLLLLVMVLNVGAGYAQDPTPSKTSNDASSNEPIQTLQMDKDAPFRVTEVLPAPGTREVATDARITVIFNRPVVPLTVGAAPDDLPDPLTLSPEVEGAGRWLNTSIYTFTPGNGFAGGTTYTATVSGLTSFDGLELAEAEWAFTTIAPRVNQVVPEPMASGVALEDPVTVTFNQRMELESVEDAFSLTVEDTGERVAGTVSWERADRDFLFIPDENLELDTLYRAQIDGDVARAVGGGMVLGDDAPNWTFLTVPNPAIVSISPQDGREDVSQYEGLVLEFASPMNEETISGRISIDPEPEFEPYTYYSSYDDSFRVNFEAEPSTDYTVTIEPGMADVYGNTIERELTISYWTGDLSPEVSLQTPGEVGLYDAARETTELYLAYRNVDDIELVLYDVPTDALIETMTNEDYSSASTYVPAQEALLREWSIDGSQIPLNVRRYDLIDMTASGIGGCSGALPSRLEVGDIGVVISEPDPLRARSEPVSGEIVELMYRDYQFDVVDGPVCAAELAWYQVELRDGQLAWIAESVDGEYMVETRVEAEGGSVPVETVEGGPLEPGIYFLTADSPQLDRDEPRKHFMVVATANVTLKVGRDSVAAWVTNLHTGEPMANTEVQLYGADGARLGSIVTDAGGAGVTLVPADLVDEDRRVVGVVSDGTDFGFGAGQWTNGINPWQFDIQYGRDTQPFGSYLYTDRPLYRTGQPVYFRGILRDKNDVTYTRPALEQAGVMILDPNGEVIYEELLALDAYGTFSATFDIAEDGELGSYRIRIFDLADTEYTINSLNFSVAEYRLPEYAVEVRSDVAEIIEGEPLNVTVDADYYFGGGVSDAMVEYVVEATDSPFRYAGDGRYSFQNYDPYDGRYLYPYGRRVGDGELMTGADGEVTFEVPTSVNSANMAAEVMVEATVRDESGVSVSGRTTAIVHPTDVYVGVGLSQYINRAGESLEAEFIAVDWDSQPVEDQEVEVIVERWQWVTVQEVDGNGNTIFQDNLQREPLAEGTVVTDADGLATFDFTPEEGGIYKILGMTVDSERRFVASQVVWVSGNDYVQWRVGNDNTLDIVTDTDEYSVGDTAQVLITSPFQGTTEVLVTVERDGVMMTQHMTMESNSMVVDLPILEEYAPNVFVGVMLVKGVDETNPIAAFRYGVTQIDVDTARKVINIEAVPDREQASPGETVTYTLRTTNYLGEPVAAQVGVGLTDLASLSLAPPNSGPILQAFYGIQSLAVGTSTTLTINTDEITAYVRDVIKGGGGGGGAVNGVFEIRGNFLDTAYWNATLETDANGEAQFAVTLPDNLTTWRLDARALTSGDNGPMLVGQDTFDLVSNLPLLVRPVTPRFFVVGDEVVISSVVNNNTGEAQDVTAFIEASGLAVSGANEQTIRIEDGARARFEWTVEAENASEVDLTFFAATADGAFTDASRPPVGLGDDRLIPIYRFDVLETAGTAGVLRDAQSVSEGIALPSDLVTGGTLDVNVDTSLASVTLDGLGYLRNYPHQCTEQTISRFMPNIVTYRALEALDLDDPALQAALDEQVRMGLQVLYTRQNTDGGWGWFSRDRSNTLVTAYVMMGLAEAQDAGYPEVSTGVMMSGLRYLQNNPVLRGVPSVGGEDWQFNREAFVLYAMARTNAADASRMANLFESRGRLNTEGHAFLALALHLADPADPRIATLTSDILSTAATSATGTFWSSEDVFNWTTSTRTTAVVLELLVNTQPDSELIPNVVRYLVSARSADAWETTQETAWSVMALTDWMVASGDLLADYEFTLGVNGETLLEDAAGDVLGETATLQVDVADLLLDEVNTLTVERGEGAGNLYYTAFLNATLDVASVEPTSNGVIVSREYVMANGDSVRAVDRAVVGDVIEVRLTVVAPEDLHYVIIEDPLPGGAEAINPDLLTSAQIGTRPSLEREGNGWGWWWFSDIDFRDEKVVLYSTYLPAGTYEYVYSIRATVPGTFNVIPTTAQEFYFPDVYGRGAGEVFTITQ